MTVKIYNELIGAIIIKIEGLSKDSELVKFHMGNGEIYIMKHLRDCCEEVSVESIDGDINDILNSPLLMAEEVTEEGEQRYDSFTWTFYKFATIKGSLTIRWYGTSNGYYSEDVSFDMEKQNEQND